MTYEEKLKMTFEEIKEELNWCIEKANEGKGEYVNTWKKGFATAYRLQAVRLFELLLREGEIKEVK
jgi:hypothetical protein